MTLPPPKVCRQIQKLHGLLGSSNDNEAAAARKKLNELLAEYGLTWNDLLEILAADAINNSARTAAASEAPADMPVVNVLDLVLRLLERHIAVTPAERIAVALWVLHTYVFDRFTFTPRLALLSPVRGCGKSTLMVLLELLTAAPYSADNVTAAAIYHQLNHQAGSTLLFDEGDNLDLLHNNVLRSVFNSDHRKGRFVSRFVGGWSQRFPTFAPLAVAAIGMLPLPLMRRSIVINMQRRAPSEMQNLQRLDENDPAFAAAREEIRKWGTTCSLALDPEMPASLHSGLGASKRPFERASKILQKNAGGAPSIRQRARVIETLGDSAIERWCLESITAPRIQRASAPKIPRPMPGTRRNNSAFLLGTGVTAMHTNGRHWLEYDWVSLAVLLIGIGSVELLVLSM
jgi:hypothetical protein